MNETVAVNTEESPNEKQLPVTAPKAWPDSANKWDLGTKVVVQDIYGKPIKSCLVVNHKPNYLVVLKVGGAFSKLTHGMPVKIGNNAFYVAERSQKQKLIGLFFVCDYPDAQKQMAKAVSDTLVTDCAKILDESPSA